jgi:hypothetical protein
MIYRWDAAANILPTRTAAAYGSRLKAGTTLNMR